MKGGGDLVFIGDVHLGAAGAHLEAFLALLDALSRTAGRVVLAGDLFDLWIGRRDMEMPHQHAVLERLAALRREGVVVRYLEGNRDYRLGPAYAGWALDDATDSGLVERFGGHSVFAIHGDLANAEDRRYRLWRRASRSPLAWAGFHALPLRTRTRLAASIEGRLRRSNAVFKAAFPEAIVRGYAAPFLGAGHDIVVLGHFHVEKDLQAVPPSPPGRIFVLPEWTGSRRHLRITAGGEAGFVDSPSGFGTGTGRRGGLGR